MLTVIAAIALVVLGVVIANTAKSPSKVPVRVRRNQRPN
jgi:uncharacterized protein YoxC